MRERLDATQINFVTDDGKPVKVFTHSAASIGNTHPVVGQVLGEPALLQWDRCGRAMYTTMPNIRAVPKRVTLVVYHQINTGLFVCTEDTWVGRKLGAYSGFKKLATLENVEIPRND